MPVINAYGSRSRKDIDILDPNTPRDWHIYIYIHLLNEGKYVYQDPCRLGIMDLV